MSSRRAFGIPPAELPLELEPRPGAARLEYSAGRGLRRAGGAVVGGLTRGAQAVGSAGRRGSKKDRTDAAASHSIHRSIPTISATTDQPGRTGGRHPSSPGLGGSARQASRRLRTRNTLDRMDSTLACLAAWMPRQRWYAAKGRPPSLRLVAWWDLPAADATVRTFLVADEGALPVVLYQIPVVARATAAVDAHPDHIIGSPEPGTTFIDGPFDPAYTSALLRLIMDGREATGPGTVVVGRPVASVHRRDPAHGDGARRRAVQHVAHLQRRRTAAPRSSARSSASCTPA